MKRTRQKRVVALQADNAEKFNREINDLLATLEDPKIVYSFPMVFVEWEEIIEKPETLQEEYELKGDGRMCGECPYFKRTKDKRYKWHFCLQKQKAVTECQGACETYYQLLEEMIKEGVK